MGKNREYIAFIYEQLLTSKVFEQLGSMHSMEYGRADNRWTKVHLWKPRRIAQMESKLRTQAVKSKNSLRQLYENQASFTFDTNIKVKLARKLMKYDVVNNLAEQNKGKKANIFSNFINNLSMRAVYNYLNDVPPNYVPNKSDYLHKPKVRDLTFGQKASLLLTPITGLVVAIVVGAIVIVGETLKLLAGPIYYPFVKKSTLDEYLGEGVAVPLYRIYRKTIYAPIDGVSGLLMGFNAAWRTISINKEYNEKLASESEGGQKIVYTSEKTKSDKKLISNQYQLLEKNGSITKHSLNVNGDKYTGGKHITRI